MSLVAVSNEITTTLQSFVVENQKVIEFKTHSEIVSTPPPPAAAADVAAFSY